MPDPLFLMTLSEEAEWQKEENMPVQTNPVVPKTDPRMGISYRTGKGKTMREQLSLLSWNKKMRAPSFDLPSLKTCPGAGTSLRATQEEINIVGSGAALRYPGICTLCYASKGPYVWPSNVTRADAKLDFSRTDDFVDTMIAAIKKPKKFIGVEFRAKQYDPRFFRVHSSGDFYDGAYIRKWAAICAACPDTLFWMPTRCWASPTTVMADMIEPLRELTALGNVILRPSTLSFNVFPTPELSTGGINWAGPSGGLIFTDLRNVKVRIGNADQRLNFIGMPELEEDWKAKGVWFCPATPRDHGDAKIDDTWNCVSQKCRHCWTRPDVPVVYRVH